MASDSSHDAKVTRDAARIAAQLAVRLDGHKTSGEAFVASIYGEWGIGKTRCLRDVQRTFEQRLDAAIASLANAEVAQIVVPVFFDPWQYEHEEHLVIPLLKTIELALLRIADRVDAVRPEAPRAGEFTERAVRFGMSVRAAGGVFGDVALSLLSAFKFKFAPLKEVIGIEVDFAPKDAIEMARKTQEKRDASNLPTAPTPWYRRLWPASLDPAGAAADPTRVDSAYQRLSRRESLYFDVRSALQALTQERSPSLRLVVLIDDLDRCLPEKAIQVLESVKLFLNVPGFSFVLAVDDEVVERGIAHRYRAYLPNAGDAVAATGLPISGAEYLEKIVHLPVHLHRWTKAEAADFLRETYPALFRADKPGDTANSGTALYAGSAARTEDLLKFVLDAVPLVPRKLIRLAEALEFQQSHFFDGLKAGDLWRPLHAARVVALQQLYPTLYRHLRLRATRYWRLFDLRRDDFGEPTLGDGASLAQIRKQFMERASPDAQARTRTQADSLRENLNLLQLVEEAGQQRGSPDPLSLFPAGTPRPEREPDGIRPKLSFDDFVQLYLHGQALPASSPVLERRTLEAAPERIASVADPARLLDALLNADTLGRREYLQAAPLDGRLPDDVFAQLIGGGLDGSRNDRLLDIEWLRDIAALTSAEQLLQLYRDRHVLEAWAAPAQGYRGDGS